jgi:hypothetical protein
MRALRVFNFLLFLILVPLSSLSSPDHPVLFEGYLDELHQGMLGEVILITFEPHLLKGEKGVPT